MLWKQEWGEKIDDEFRLLDTISRANCHKIERIDDEFKEEARTRNALRLHNIRYKYKINLDSMKSNYK